MIDAAEIRKRERILTKMMTSMSENDFLMDKDRQEVNTRNNFLA